MDLDHLHGRLEDRRLVTGNGRYASDHKLAGELQACFLRSDRAHAEIRAIDASAALAMPGVRAVLTGEDVKAAGFGFMPTQLPVNGRDGKPFIKTNRPVLAQGRVRFVGEAVAIAVAETRAQAQDAAEAIVVDYHDLPAFSRPTDAIAAGAPQLHENVPGNRVIDLGTGDEAKTEATFASAPKVVSITLYNNRVVANPMEPRAAMGFYDAQRDRYVLYTVTQGVNLPRGQLAGVLNVEDSKIDIIAKDVGGGFGVRSNLYPEYPALILASKKLGAPVKWVASRSEVFLADEQARDVHTTAKAAVDANGRVLAFRFDFVTNLGAYCAPAGPFINSRVTACVNGVYDVPVLYARNQLVLSNTAPLGAYRGAGRPIMSSALERLMTQIARELGKDEAEVRRINMIPKSKFPYTLVNGNVYDCGDPIGVMDAAMKAAQWTDAAAFAKRQAAAKARGKLLGRGMACAIESTAAGNVPDHVDMRFADDGTLVMYTASHSQGQGHETAYAQIVARVLGVPLESIRLIEGDPVVRTIGNQTGGSRSTHGVGAVLKLGADEIVKKGLTYAAGELEAAEGDIEFAAGHYRIKGTDRKVSLQTLARKLGGKGEGGANLLDVKTNSKIGPTYPNGCHIAEVEIDVATGMVKILSYIACDDAGNIINHQLVEGQMHGSLTQGTGQVLGEQSIYDEAGQLLTGSFMDYPMPKAGWWGDQTIQLVDFPVPTATNPLGAKGVGEAGVTGSLPTVMNAITDALRQAGVTRFDMPATPARVWAALQGAQAGKADAMAVAPLA